MQIRIDRLFDCYKIDDCRRTIARFLHDQGKWRKTEDLWKDFNKRYYGITDSKKETLSNTKKIQEMLLVARESYYFEGTYDGVFLREEIILDFHNINHKPYFKYFFPYLLLQHPDPQQFLEYHLTNTFNGDKNNFRLFLSLIDKHVVGERIGFLNEWIATIEEQRIAGNIPVEVTSGDDVTGVTVVQIALAIYYKIKAGSLPDFDHGEKTRKIEQIARQERKSPKTLQTAYTQAATPGERGSNFRRKALNDQSNLQAISLRLNGDEKALLELKRDIDKRT